MPSRSTVNAAWIVSLALILGGTVLLAGAATGRFYEGRLYGLQEKGTLYAALGGLVLYLVAGLLLGPIISAWHRRRQFRWVLEAERA
ncbi:MAG: hypothetical protein AAF333_17590 [Planctomycetota bacterium]